MKLFEQFKQDLALRRTVARLDLSAGMTDAPSLTAFDDTDPRLAAYLSGLRRVKTIIKNVADYPEAVFLGDIISGNPSNSLTLIGQSNEDRKIPPRHAFAAEFPDVDTIDSETTVRHLTHLVAANFGIAAEDQKPLADKAVKSLKKNYGIVSEVEITPEWKFGAWVNERSGTVTPRLIPVEQPEYSQHWVERQKGLIEQSIRPEALRKAVMTAAEKNYCVTETEIMRVDKMDTDGMPGAIKLVEKQGYEPLSVVDIDPDDEATLSLILDNIKVYQHTDSKPEDGNARLGIQNTWLGKDVRFSAIASPALREEIRGEFGGKFKSAAKLAISQRIDGVPADMSLINLSPASLIEPTLESIGHKLQNNDREQEEDWLSSIVAEALVAKLRRYPDSRPIAERLALIEAFIEDQSALPHDPNAEIDFGLNAAAMQFILPKKWFGK